MMMMIRQQCKDLTARLM